MYALVAQWIEPRTSKPLMLVRFQPRAQDWKEVALRVSCPPAGKPARPVGGDSLSGHIAFERCILWWLSFNGRTMVCGTMNQGSIPCSHPCGRFFIFASRVPVRRRMLPCSHPNVYLFCFRSRRTGLERAMVWCHESRVPVRRRMLPCSHPCGRFFYLTESCIFS